MEYRLLCVYKCNKNAVEQVDIEVNRELHTSTLAPFNRNVSVEDLAYSSLSSPRNWSISLTNMALRNSHLLYTAKCLALQVYGVCSQIILGFTDERAVGV